MTRWEQAWAADVLTAFTQESDTGLSPLPAEVDYLTTFRRMRRGSTKLAALGLRAAVWMVALAPLWLFGRVATFSSLARADRTELLRTLLAHRILAIRELTLLLKLTAAMALLGTASVRARSGYDDVTAQRAARGASNGLHVVRVPHPATSAQDDHEHERSAS